MAPLKSGNGQSEMATFTQQFVDALLTKISRLEKENKDLRAKVQQLESKEKQEKSRPKVKRRDSVVFDGLRASFHVNKLQNPREIFGTVVEEEPNGRHVKNNRSNVSALSMDSGLSEDASEDELSSYIERRFSNQSDSNRLSAQKSNDERRGSSSSKGSRNKGGIVKKIGRELSRRGSKLLENELYQSDSNSDADENRNTGDDFQPAKIEMKKSRACRRQHSLEDEHRASSKKDSSTYDSPSKSQISFSLGERKTNRYLLGSMMKHNEGWTLFPARKEQALKNAKEKEEKAKQKKLFEILTTIGMMSAKSSLTKALNNRSGEKQVSFQNFYLFSLDHSKNYELAEMDLVTCGSSFLSPFSTSGVECIDRFPKQKIENELDPMEISPFCCPDGLKLRMFPRVGLAGAKRMGWLGNRADQYKLLVFTDGNGMTKLGIAITVFEEVSRNQSDYEGLKEVLLRKRNRRFAARKIQRWWKRLPRKQKRRTSSRRNSKSLRRRSSIDDIGRSLQSLFKSNSNKSLVILDDDSFDDTSFDMFQSGSDSVSRGSTSAFSSFMAQSDLNDSASSTPTLPLFLTPKRSLDQNRSEDQGETSTTQSEPNFDDSLLGGFMDWSGSYHHEHSVALQGKEAFEIMNASAKLGDVIIIEKCYVMIGGSEQYLQFKLLHHMITKEQEETWKSKRKEGRKKKKKSLNMPNILALNGTSSEEGSQRKSTLDFRHIYLEAVHEGLLLTEEQVKACNNAERITDQTEAQFKINLPTYTSESYSFNENLPLPRVDDHWGLAALVARVNPKDLLILLKLLLIERSVLVIGDSPHLVTACTCALLHLLKPYHWASNFMPLLPGSMLDFVGSPVPFLIGMTVESVAKSRSLQRDERVVDAMSSGLSVVNLSTKSVHLTTETGIVPLLKCCPTPAPHLYRCKRKLENLRKQSPSLRSFVRFIKDGLSNHEICAIIETQQLIHTFMAGLSDNIATDPGAWRYYSKNGNGEAYDFYPGLFVDRLKHQMKSLESRVQFQEMMAYSQLFVEFVDSKRRASLEEDMLRRAIGNWIYHKWKLKKMKQTKPRFQAQTFLSSICV